MFCAVKVSLWGLYLLVGVYSLIIIISECFLVHPQYTLIFQLIEGVDNFYLTYFGTLFFLLTIMGYALFTLANIKFYDFYRLVPYYTDALTMSSVSGLCSKCV